MKYYSELCRKFYDTEREALEAEKKVKDAEAAKKQAETKKKAERASRAKEVEEAIKAADKATEKAQNLLNAFLKDYGSFHTTIHEETDPNGHFTRHSIFGSELNDLFTDVLRRFLGE